MKMNMNIFVGMRWLLTLVPASMLLCCCEGIRYETWVHPVSAEAASDPVLREVFSLSFADYRGNDQQSSRDADLAVILGDAGYTFTSSRRVFSYSVPALNALAIETGGYLLLFAEDPNPALLPAILQDADPDLRLLLILSAPCAPLANMNFTDVIVAQRGGESAQDSHPCIYANDGAWTYLGTVGYDSRNLNCDLEILE